MDIFIFDSYSFDPVTGTASFKYKFSGGRNFEEKVVFNPQQDYDKSALDKALFLSFVLIGVSYWKTFPTPNVKLSASLDEFQANFFNVVYQEGMAQFAYENKLSRDSLAHFSASTKSSHSASRYDGRGIVTLQSGGKDSLLTATLLEKAHINFVPWFLASGDHHPAVLDNFSKPLLVAKRSIDRIALEKAAKDGAMNGHVPITYIVESLALIQAILLRKNQILVSVANEGVEAHAHIGDLAVNHQWSKTWEAEQAFSAYVANYISPDIQVGSPLRALSELKTAELFVKHSWDTFGRKFSSCNVANYRQHADNSELKWCGNCAKCANTYLLFAPFIAEPELNGIFNNQNLMAKPSLEHDFKGLLGIDGVIKPFECVGETEELRAAYHMLDKSHQVLPFAVPVSSYDYNKLHPHQSWAYDLIKDAL